VGQVVSLKMVTEPEGIVDRINDQLPHQLRVHQRQTTTLILQPGRHPGVFSDCRHL
jgi:tRNA U38,U39,U40 pseudouridine synthase TruA